ncbi:MAG: ATP-dependent DNA ligase [Actinomycetota bacterium]|nr:ATP-dependent DNA ligase [Actinomycetota bacterium]
MSLADLPVPPPLSPMLAKSVKQVPAADAVEGGLAYEPKWDGFRCVVFRDGDEVELGSRNERPLTRYFPEVVEALRDTLPPRCVVDGEIIVAVGDRLEFERLLDRIHPADSRVRRLASETPASYVAFDLLAFDDHDLTGRPFAERRQLLEEALRRPGPRVHLTPLTTDASTARQWFDAFEGAGLDGVVAKPMAAPYVAAGRTMLKIKHQRTADVVVAGYRLHKTSTPEQPRLGSLLLGLHTSDGRLQHVGVCASFTASRRADLVAELEPWRLSTDDERSGHPWGWGASEEDAAEGRRRPGNTSRWNAGKDLSFVPLRPERVAEVGYDHLQGDRFRHTTQFKRWRPDRDARSCTYAQLQEPVSYDLQSLLTG